MLAPNQGIQQQWPRAVGEFTPNPAMIAGADPLKPIACLSYQALCQLEDPEIVLGRLAQSRWAGERAAATGMTPDEALREGEAFSGAAADRRARELSRISAALKREVARGEHAGVELRDLLSETARRRVQQLAKMGVGVVLLDECHHLASLWGYVVRAVLGELGEQVHVIGLTATPPIGLPEAEAELYAALLGPVDFTVPTPAVVRDGHLAPYQELAWLTEPLQTEREWLAEHDTRFRELITTLHDDAESDVSFPRWVGSRMRERKRSADDEAQVPWEAFQKRSPKLARAGIRFLLSAGLSIPTGAPRGEAYRQSPDLEDWLALLEDYALRCLASSQTREAGERYDAISAALRELGFQLTRQGIRRGTSEVDRLLTGSQAKALGLVEVLSAELDNRGDALRALVLCDAELAAQRSDDALTGVLDPAAGTARHVLLAIAADGRTAPLRPLLVSGRGLRCAPQDADVLLEALKLAAEDRFTLPEWEAEVDGLLVTLRSSGAEWMPRAWVELATTLLVEGTTGVLVGTRALLGEGWNCRPLNVLVDMTVATTGVSVQQMRGRTLRLDPADPEKVASNWDVVCVAPDLVRGTADYERFARKHLHLFAPAEDGEVEAGPSHVHPEMGPFAPPPVERFRDLNAAQLARASDRASARERWQVGTPYRGVELPTLLVRPSRPGAPPPVLNGSSRRSSSRSAPRSRAGSAARVALGALGVATGTPLELAGLALAPLGLGVAAVRLGRVKKRLPLILPLDAAARAVAEAYRELGELSADAAGSLTIEPRAAGYLRVELTKATPGRGQEVRRGARRADGRLRRAALPRLAAARRPRPRRARPARPGADPPAAVRRAPAPRAEGPGPQQGARGGLRARLGPPRRPGPARLHPAQRGRPRGARRGRVGRRRLRDAGQRRLGLTQGVLGRVLAVLGGAVDGVGALAGRRAPVRERARGLLGGVAPGVEHRAPLGRAAQHDLPRVGHVVEEGSKVAGTHRRGWDARVTPDVRSG